MWRIYLASADNILRTFDSDTWYIIYRDAGYISKRLYTGKPTKKKSATKILSWNTDWGMFPHRRKKKCATYDCSGFSFPGCLSSFVISTKNSWRFLIGRWLNQKRWMSIGCLTLIFHSELFFPSGLIRWSDILPKAGQRWTYPQMETAVFNCINKC